MATKGGGGEREEDLGIKTTVYKDAKKEIWTASHLLSA